LTQKPPYGAVFFRPLLELFGIDNNTFMRFCVFIQRYFATNVCIYSYFSQTLGVFGVFLMFHANNRKIQTI